MHSILQIDSDENDGLAELVSNITMRYLAHLFAICVIWTTTANSTRTPPLDATLKLSQPSQFNGTSSGGGAVTPWPTFYLLTTQSNDAAAAEKLADDIETALNIGCQAFIIATDVANAALTAIAAAIPPAVNRYPHKHFVFVPTTRTNQTTQTQMTQILSHPLLADLPNVLVISAGQPKAANLDADTLLYDLYTTRFVGSSAATAAGARWLDAFEWHNRTAEQRFRRNVHLFPDKLHNLQGRSVRMAMFNYEPYTVVEEVAAGLGNANALNWRGEGSAERTMAIDGTEAILMQLFCRLHNCTLEVSVDEAGQWGEIYDNRSGIGVLGAIAEGRVDMSIAALYMWYHEYQFLDFTMTISRTGVTCIVPKPQLLSGLYLPAMPFSWPMWLGVLVSMIVGAVALIGVEYVQHRQKIGRGDAVTAADLVRPGEIAFQICVMYLFQASNMMSNPGAEKLILTCVLLIGLMIGNAYAGGLASIMTVPQFEEPIDTAHQMAEHSLEWGGTQDAWLFSILLATQPDIKKLVRLFHAAPAAALRERTETRDFGFSLERLPYGSYAIGEYIDEAAMDYLQLMRTDIYYEYTLVMTSKTWPLKSALDTMITRVVQSGIQAKWEWQMVVKYSDDNVQRRVATSHSSHNDIEPEALDVARVLGAFVIWLIGIAASAVCFVVEFAQRNPAGMRGQQLQQLLHQA